MKNEFESMAALIADDLVVMKRAVDIIQASNKQIRALIKRTPEAKSLIAMTVDKAYEFHKMAQRENQIDIMAVINAYVSGAEYLAAIYTGMEIVLQRIFGLTGEEIKKAKKRTGDKDHVGWHKDLLTLASLDIKGVRTAIIDKSFAAYLEDNYLGFRHLVRHNYPFKLDLRLVSDKMKQSSEIVHRFEKEIQSFLDLTRQSFSSSPGR